MTRNIHDTFAKEWMQELLADFGRVEVEKPVSGEVRTIDIVFYPDVGAIDALQALGLMGRMLSQPSLVEAFRNATPQWEILNCRDKSFDVRAELRRQAKARKQRLREADEPMLWILSPTMSPAMQKRFCVVEKSRWGKGIYFLPAPDRTAVIAIHHLSKTLDTLWLRLFGRDKVQAEAVKELLALPPTHPYRQETLRHLMVLQVNLKIRQNKTKDIREVMMSLAPAYEKWLKETLDQGRQEGRQEGHQEGRQEGQVEVALRLLQRNMAIAEVAECTGLPIAQVKKLRP
jgi:hypothetical protein